LPKIPGINHLDAVRALERAGFQIARQGKHIVMTDGIRIVTIPRHNPVNAFTMGEHSARCRAFGGRVSRAALDRRFTITSPAG
jgi:hypothetical protein